MYVITSNGDIFANGAQDSEVVLPSDISLTVDRLSNKILPTPLRYFWSFHSAMRPVFYLKDDVKYVSGDGSIDSPYRIN